MSQKAPVLYGQRPYGPTLYNIAEDFETFNASLSDSTSLSDARVIDTITKALSELLSFSDDKNTSGIKALTDTATLTDALVKSLTTHFADSLSMSDAEVATATKAITDALSVLDSTLTTIGTKPLSDSSVLTDQLAASLQKVLTDTFVILDSQILTTGTKSLTDFILLKEWISITLRKVNPWHLVSATQRDIPTYGTLLYGQSLYGFTPDVVWNKPQPSKKSFTNRDGEAHQ